MSAFIVSEVACLLLVIHNLLLSVGLHYVMRATTQGCPRSRHRSTSTSVLPSTTYISTSETMSFIVSTHSDSLEGLSDNDELSTDPRPAPSTDDASEDGPPTTSEVDTPPSDETTYSPTSTTSLVAEDDAPRPDATSSEPCSSTQSTSPSLDATHATTPASHLRMDPLSPLEADATDDMPHSAKQLVHCPCKEAHKVPRLTRSSPTVASDSDNNSLSSTDDAAQSDLVLIPSDHPAGLPLMDNFPGRHMKFIDDYDNFGPKPGPFGLIGSLEPGSCGMVLAARDLSLAKYLDGSKKASRVFCLKTFEKKESVRRGYIHLVLQELKAYQTWYVRGKMTWGSMFVMDLHASMQDAYRFYFVMEMMTCDLLAVFSPDPDIVQFKLDHKTRWIAQIAVGLRSLHEAGIIHRDIKPENVLLDSRCNVRITDLGSAHISQFTRLRRDEEYSTTVLGTWPYLAPEVLDLKNTHVTGITKPYGPAIDWWALGCMAFELESEMGEPLFNTEDDLRAYQYAQTCPEGLGRTWWAPFGLRKEVEAVIVGLLQIDPATRFNLSDLREEPYFDTWFGSPDASIFDDIEEEALYQEKDPNSLRKYHTKQITDIIHPTVNNREYNGTKYSINNFSWVNPDGLWGKLYA